MKNQNLKLNYYLVILVFIATLALYLPLTSNTPQITDSGELVTTAILKAPIHPPGYPIFSLTSQTLVKIFPKNPFKTLSLFSAIMQSLAGSLIFVSSFLLSKNYIIAAALSFSWITFGPSVYTATDAEVFGLHHFFCSLLAFLGISFLLDNSNKTKNLVFISLLSGVFACHHQTIIFWAPLILACIIKHGEKNGFFKSFAISVSSAIIGLTPYFLLLFYFDPKNTVAFSAPDNLRDFLAHVLRSGYGTFSLGSSGAVEKISYFPHFLKYSLTVIPLIILAPLLALFSKKKSFLKWGLISTCLLYLFFASKLNGFPFEEKFLEITHRFWPTIILPFTLLLSFAVGEIIPKTKTFFYIILFLILFPSLLTLNKNINMGDANNDKIVQIEINQIAKEIPMNALILTSQDRIGMGMQYLQLVKKERRDLISIIPGLIPAKPYQSSIKKQVKELRMIEPWNLTSIINWALKNNRRVFAYHDTLLPKELNMIYMPFGLMWEVVNKDREVKHFELASRLFSFCSEWDEELNSGNSERKYTQAIKNIYFLYPIEKYIGFFQDDILNSQLKTIFKLFKKNQIFAAKKECSRTLEMIRNSVN